MLDKEFIEYCYFIWGKDLMCEVVIKVFVDVNEEFGFGCCMMICNFLFVVIVVLIIFGVMFFCGFVLYLILDDFIKGDLVVLFKYIMWEKGVCFVCDFDGILICVVDVMFGFVFYVILEEFVILSYYDGYFEEKVKVIVLMMCLCFEQLIEVEDCKDWFYDGIVVYFKVCMYVGCFVVLYEQQMYYLLCLCYQLQFDVMDYVKVIFGLVVCLLLQLFIIVDDEGYLIVCSDFIEFVGLSFWECY